MRIAVTGAFGYSGKYIARRLLGAGLDVLTLTSSPGRPNSFGPKVKVAGFDFDHPERLRQSLAGVDALINTYWVRFDHKLFTHAQAVANTKVMFQVARDAGVRRIVHVSITKPDRASDLPYFSGKAELEEALAALGGSYCILRPTVLFGKEDVLVNNIAWGLRHVPVFGIFGDGQYRLQPIYVDDLAEAAVEQAMGSGQQTIDAIGPETFTYRGMVEMIGEAIGLRRRIISMTPSVGLAACKMLGWLVKDVVITKEEVKGLMEERLYVESPPLGQTRLSAWVWQNRERLGLHYTSEIARRIDRVHEYRSN